MPQKGKDYVRFAVGQYAKEKFNLCMKSRLQEIPRLAGLKIHLHCRLGICFNWNIKVTCEILEIFQQGSQQAISSLLKI